MRRLILLACSVAAVGAFLPGSARPAVGGSDLPYKATIAGSFTFDPVTGQSEIVGNGQLSHLGLATSDEHAQLVPTGPTTFINYYTQTLTAANGDQLFSTGVGSGTLTDPVHATIVADYVSTGGSGRFAAASLSAHATVHITFLSAAAGTWEATGVGRLSYR